MRVGSLVVCVDDVFESEYFDMVKSKGIMFPVKGAVYKVRSFDNVNNIHAIRVEEIVNRNIIFNDGLVYEQSFKISRFRELDTPTEINLENILKNELV